MKNYRPIKFEDLYGTSSFITYIDKITDIKKIPKTLLFYGDSGAGKTTCSRLLSAKLMQLNDEETSQLLTKGSNFSGNYYEINASSNNGVSAARQLEKDIIETSSAVISGPFIFVLTEAHRLTTEAQDALLDVFEKVQEEVYDDVYLILTTTNTSKFSIPFLRRFTQYEFTNLGYDEMVRFIKDFSKEQNFMEFPETEYKRFFDITKGSPGLIIAALISYNNEGKIIVESDEIETKASDVYKAILKISKSIIRDINTPINLEELKSKITGLIKISGSPEIAKLKILYVIRNTLYTISQSQNLSLDFITLEYFQKWIEILSPEIQHNSNAEFDLLQRILKMIIIRTKPFIEE